MSWSRTAPRASRPAARTGPAHLRAASRAGRPAAGGGRARRAHGAVVYVAGRRPRDAGRAARSADARDPVAGPTVTVAPEAFVAGRGVGGRRRGRRPAGRARDKLLRVTERGVGGAPTLVQNVETLAHLALIARHGPRWFRAGGHRRRAGHLPGRPSSGAVVRAGGRRGRRTASRSATCRAAGGPTEPLQAVLVGGYPRRLGAGRGPGSSVSRAALAPFGASAGAGRRARPRRSAVRPGRDGPDRRLPGRRGRRPVRTVPQRPARGWPTLGRAGQRAAAAAAGRGGAARRAGRDGRGACRHPDGTARMIRSALRMFAADVAAHLAAAAWPSPRSGR